MVAFWHARGGGAWRRFMYGVAFRRQRAARAETGAAAHVVSTQFGITALSAVLALRLRTARVAAHSSAGCSGYHQLPYTALADDGGLSVILHFARGAIDIGDVHLWRWRRFRCAWRGGRGGESAARTHCGSAQARAALRAAHCWRVRRNRAIKASVSNVAPCGAVGALIGRK